MPRSTHVNAVDDDPRFPRPQAAAYTGEGLGRSVSITTLIYTFKIPYVVDGRTAVYRKSDLDAFIAKRRAEVAQQVRCYEGTPRSKPPVNRIARPDTTSTARR
jgi:hypothetical protein